MKLKRFTKPEVLKQIGRGLLEQFFARFNGQVSRTGSMELGAGSQERDREFRVDKLVLPPASASDEEFFQGVLKICTSPEGLPAELGEALYLVDELANSEGHERLHAAAAKAGLDLSGDHTEAELALKVYMHDPKVLERVHMEQRLVRLTSFEYYGTRRPPEQRGTFVTPTPEALAAMAKRMDRWFAEHNRGQETVRVEIKEIDGEHFFTIRHGDTFTRTAKVNQQKTEMLHFRGEKGDVSVFSPELHELRIKAGTKGERELYRTEFGILLFGDAEYFVKKNTYTLDVLLKEGIDGLDVSGCGDLVKVVLREFWVQVNNNRESVLIWKAADVFADAELDREKWEVFTKGVKVVRASFDLYFAGQKKPRKLTIRTPRTLKLGRHCDVRAVQEWLSRAGFRAVDGGKVTGMQPKWMLRMGGKVLNQSKRMVEVDF